MENIDENDVLEATDEAKNAKAGLANVSRGLAKGTGKFIGGSCRAARRFSKEVKQCGERIAGVGHGVAAEDDPYVQLAEPVGEVADDTDVVEFKPSAALDPGQEEATSGKRATRALVVALESDLKAARAELEAMRSQGEGTNAPLTSQLKALQEEKESLLADLEQANEKLDQADQVQAELTSQLKTFQDEEESFLADLEQTRSQINEMTAHKDALSECATALESDLAATKDQLDQARSQVRQVQDEFKSQLNALKKKKDESLIADLEKARNEVDETKSREEQAAGTVQAEPDSIIAETEQGEAAAEPVEERIVPVITEIISQPTEKGLVEVKEQQEQVTETEASTSADAVVENEPVETEEQQLEALAAEEAVKTETAPAEVTAEEVNAAVFDRATEKIIFTKALSDMASQDEMARIDAAKAIGGIRHELSVRVLVARMATEPIPQVRSECIKALTTLNTKEGLPVIEHALADQIPSVRLAAVRALYRIAGAGSGPTLIRMFCDEDESIRRRAVVCIGWLGKKEFATTLVPLLNDSSISVRQATIEAMANLCSRAVVSALIEHLGDPEKVIREAIIAALKTITGKKMSGPFPGNEKSIQQLIVRWRQWWNEQYPE